MEFLDRQAEMRRLVRLHEEGRGGFVAVWGRRRIGKSELMKAWCRATGGLYAVADRSLSAVQRQDFAQLVESRFTGFSAVTYPTWKSLFAELARRAPPPTPISTSIPTRLTPLRPAPVAQGRAIDDDVSSISPPKRNFPCQLPARTYAHSMPED